MAIGLLRFRSSIIVWTITSEPSKPSLSSVEKMMKIIMFFNELKFSVCLPQFSSATVPKVNSKIFPPFSFLVVLGVGGFLFHIIFAKQVPHLVDSIEFLSL